MRQVEEFTVSPIEQELSFRAWCGEKDIRMILLDGDETQWQTEWIYRKQMGICYDLLAETGIMSREEWKKKVVVINNELFETHGVNPEKCNIIVERLADNYPIDKNIQNKAKNILAEIYHIPPKFIDGTEEGLKFLKKSGIPMGIVTHAGVEWTWRKYNWLQLQRFYSWDDIYTVDENGHKTIDSWRKAMRYFGTEPKYCLVGGDSPRTDINPVCELGVEHCFLVENPSEIWSIHQQPMDEIKTRKIKSINDLRWLGKELVYGITSSQN